MRYRHLTRIMFWSQDKEQPYIHCQGSVPSTVQASSSPSLPSQSPHSLLPRLATENKLEDEIIKTCKSIVKKVDKKFTDCV